MTVDNEEQRQMLLAVVEQANWPGTLAEKVAQLKAALRSAALAKPRKV